MEKLVIKRCGAEDLADTIPLIGAYRKFYRKEAVEDNVLQVFLENRIRNNEVVIFLAVLEGRAVGVAQLYSCFSVCSLAKVWTLYDLYVDENHRKMGIARQLLQHCKTFAKEDGACKLELKTENTNLPGHTLYQSFGFAKDTDFTHYALPL